MKKTKFLLFRTNDGLVHFGEFYPSARKFYSHVYAEFYYASKVVEWWDIPEEGTGFDPDELVLRN
jgi:hypothetical protein